MDYHRKKRRRRPLVFGNLEYEPLFTDTSQVPNYLPQITTRNNSKMLNSSLLVRTAVPELSPLIENTAEGRKKADLIKNSLFEHSHNIFNETISHEDLKSIYSGGSYHSGRDEEKKGVDPYLEASFLIKYYKGTNASNNESKLGSEYLRKNIKTPNESEIFERYNIHEDMSEINDAIRSNGPIRNKHPIGFLSGQASILNDKSNDRSMLLGSSFLTKHSIVEDEVPEKFPLIEFKNGNKTFNDPVSALATLQINKQIQDNVDRLFNMKKKEKKEHKYEKLNRMKVILERMPSPKVSKSDVYKIKELKPAVTDSDGTDRSKKELNANLLASPSKAPASSMMKALKPTIKVSRDNLFNNLFFQGTYTYHQKIRPFCRGQFTLSLVGAYIYIFGGLNSQRLNDMWKCDLQSEDYRWSKVNINDEIPLARCGHSAAVKEGDIYIYGGNLDQKLTKPREDILIFDTRAGKFQKNTKCFNKVDVPWRRNHISVNLGQHLLVHGGIDDKDNVLNDVHLLQYSEMRWSRLDTKNTQSPYLAYHSVAVAISERKIDAYGYHVYKTYEGGLNNKTTKVKNEGIIFFGGIDKNNDYVTTNDLVILKVNEKPCRFETLSTNGIAPEPRRLASANYLEDLHVVFVYGGKNDKKSRNQVFKDMFILDLINLNWYSVKTYDGIAKERYEHSGVVFGNKVIIFGGMDDRMLVATDLFVITVDIFTEKKSNSLNFTQVDEYELKRSGQYVEKDQPKKKAKAFRFEDRLLGNSSTKIEEVFSEKIDEERKVDTTIRKRNSVMIEKDKNKSSKHVIPKFSPSKSPIKSIKEMPNEEEIEELKRKNFIRSHTRKISGIEQEQHRFHSSESMKLDQIDEFGGNTSTNKIHIQDNPFGEIMELDLGVRKNIFKRLTTK